MIARFVFELAIVADMMNFFGFAEVIAEMGWMTRMDLTLITGLLLFGYMNYSINLPINSMSLG